MLSGERQSASQSRDEEHNKHGLGRDEERWKSAFTSQEAPEKPLRGGEAGAVRAV